MSEDKKTKRRKSRDTIVIDKLQLYSMRHTPITFMLSSRLAFR